MASESEHEASNQPPVEYAGAGPAPGGGPPFVASPGSEGTRTDQPRMAPSASAPAAATPNRPDPAGRDRSQADPKTASPPRDAQGMSSGGRLAANTLLIALGAGVMAGGFALGRVYAPPKPPGEVSNQMPADAVSKEDMKKLTDQVEKFRTDLDGLSKQVAARPDFGPDIKMTRDELTDLKGSITDFPARFDSLTQKIETIGRTQTAQAGGSAADPKGDVDKRIADLSAVIDNLRSEMSARPTAAGGANTPRDGSANGQAIEQAAGLFRAKKFNEARDAFRKLQTTDPADARVNYYAALSNGWATGEWQGETVRLVNAAMELEKTGHPSTAQVDATFADLTKAEGREWLDGYRQRIKAR